MARVKLNSVSKLITKGTTPSTIGGCFVESGVNFIKSESICDSKYLNRDVFEHIDEKIDNKLKRSKLAQGDLLFSIAGAYLGKIGIVRDFDLPANTNQAVGIVRLDKTLVDVDYIYYYFSQPHINQYINNLSSQSSQPNLNLDLLGNLEFELKDLVIQRQIAAVLSTLDSKIEVNNRINAELEAMVKTLYDYWFVQFDFPNADGKPYKTNGGKMVWNDELRRKIPEGWEAKTLGEICHSNKVQLNSKSDYDYINYLDTSNITQNRIESVAYIPFSERPSRAQRVVEANDIIYSTVRPNQQHHGIVKIPVQNMIVSTGFTVLSHRNNKSLNDIIYLYLSSSLITVFLQNIAQNSVSAYPSINTNDILELKVVWPLNEDILLGSAELIGNFHNQIHQNQGQNQQLSALRDWLLPMLMNGQVRVGGEAGEQVQEVEPNERLFIANHKKPFAKQVLGGRIVSLSQDDPHFNNIKFQKLQYLAEHLAEVDLQWNYYYQAAGPYDNVYMHSIADRFAKSQWFARQDNRYVPLDKQPQIDDYYESFFKPVQPRLDQLFALLANATDIEAEIIATLYAVWNNRIILNQPVTEAALIEDFYNWSERKLMNTPEKVTESLKWMHTHQIIPVGFGKELKRAKGKK